MAYYTDLAADFVPVWRRSFALGAVLGLHALALLAIVGLRTHPELARPLQALTVRMIEPEPTPPAVKLEPPKAKPASVTRSRQAPAPRPPVLVAAPDAAAPAFSVPPQPAARPVEIRPDPPLPAPVVAARFDADYLQNPAPVYPLISRRRGEAGKVVLRVRVSVEGNSLAIEVKQSSGFARLDEAARSAVERWRFIPARQGSETVELTVLVPLNFTLDS